MKPQYNPTRYSDMTTIAAKEAWEKLPDDEREALQAIIDELQAEQRKRNNAREGDYRHTIATGGVELLAKLGMFLNGVRYAEYIQDGMKGQRTK